MSVLSIWLFVKFICSAISLRCLRAALSICLFVYVSICLNSQCCLFVDVDDLPVLSKMSNVSICLFYVWRLSNSCILSIQKNLFICRFGCLSSLSVCLIYIQFYLSMCLFVCTSICLFCLFVWFAYVFKLPNCLSTYL